LGPSRRDGAAPPESLNSNAFSPIAVGIVEVFDVARLAGAMEMNDALAVALDAPGSEELAGAVAVAGHRPVLRPLWRRERNSRREVDELFDGYGLLTTGGVERLADGQLSIA
jgi:hypothetical protein